MIRRPLRSRAPSQSEQVRKATRQFGRLVYLVLGLFTYLTWIFIGPVLFLRSDGIVTSDRFVVGAAYTASVIEVDVRPGDTVREGQRLLTLESLEVLRSLADLTQNVATLRTREQQLEGRRRTAETLLPIAGKRLRQAQEATKAVTRADAQGAATFTFQAQVTREAFEAEREKVSLETEMETLESELRGVRHSIEELRGVLDRTRRSYSDGEVTALGSGTVGPKVPSPGQVVQTGDALLEVMTGAPYVLSYLPAGRLYEVAAGDEVVVTDGVRIAKGRIERIDAVADNLPPEFRTAFGYLERQQVMRIALLEGTSFPYLSRVEVVSPWGLSHLFALVKGRFSAAAM